MTQYYIKDFREEHRNILAALASLEKDIEVASDNFAKLNTIKKFFEDYFESTWPLCDSIF